MEQLINAATIPYYVTTMLFILGGAFIAAIIFIFVAEEGNIRDEVKIIITLFIIGAILLASGVHCKNVYSKNNDQARSITKSIIAKEYPDAVDFYWSLDTGSFTENGIKHEIEYKKTVNNEEKLIVTVKDGQAKSNNAKTFDIPKNKTK